MNSAVFFALHVVAFLGIWFGVIFVIAWCWGRWQRSQKSLDSALDSGGVNTANGGQRVHHGLPIDLFETDPIRADQDEAWDWVDELLRQAGLTLLFVALCFVLLATVFFAAGFFN